MGAGQHDTSLARVCREVMEVETWQLIQTPGHGSGGWAKEARHQRHIQECSVQKARKR